MDYRTSWTCLRCGNVNPGDSVARGAVACRGCGVQRRIVALGDASLVPLGTCRLHPSSPTPIYILRAFLVGCPHLINPSVPCLPFLYPSHIIYLHITHCCPLHYSGETISEPVFAAVLKLFRAARRLAADRAAVANGTYVHSDATTSDAVDGGGGTSASAGAEITAAGGNGGAKIPPPRRGRSSNNIPATPAVATATTTTTSSSSDANGGRGLALVLLPAGASEVEDRRVALTSEIIAFVDGINIQVRACQPTLQHDTTAYCMAT